jgi:general stress protein 26
MDWQEMSTHATGTAHLGTATSSGRPHVSQVATWLEERAVWFATGRTSRKARNLLDNPFASLMWTPHAELYVQGAAELIDDVDTKRRFWDAGVMGYDARSFWGEPETPTAVLVRVTPASAVLYLGDESGAVTPHRWRAA